MRYLSVCSGIEAATVAWHPLGWEAAAYSEIEKFPSQVLAHHYPNTPNVGDMTKFKEWKNVSDVNVLVGGTPCQSFSVAGLRKGLDDPRGNLMLTYLAIAAKYRPKWLVWENVPGVLSSNGGRDFGSFLGGLAECGYGFAYRVLDAQYFGVAQRRRRVFVVGYLGNWRPAAAVLFERHSLCGYSAPSREKGQDAATGAASGLDVSCIGTLTAGFGKLGAPEIDAYTALPVKRWPAEISSTLDTTFGSKQGLEDQHVNAGCPMFVPVQPIPIHDQATRHAGKNGDKTMGKGNGLGIGQPGEPMNTLTKGDHHAVFQAMAVRRLTCVECERLQGFPDNYTNIRDKCPDGPRYKALGNSMAVPVMRWIGERIAQVEAINAP